MATHGDRLDSVEQRLNDLERSLDIARTNATVHIDNLKDVVKDLQGIVREIQATDLRRAEADAKLDQRCAALEKSADRRWQMWLAIVGLAFGLIGVLLRGDGPFKK